MMSSYQGHTETARLLVSHGADIHIATSAGMTALRFGTDSNHTEITELLREHGASEQHDEPGEHGPIEQCIHNQSKTLSLRQLDQPSILTNFPDTSHLEARLERMEKILEMLVQTRSQSPERPPLHESSPEQSQYIQRYKSSPAYIEQSRFSERPESSPEFV